MSVADNQEKVSVLLKNVDLVEKNGFSYLVGFNPNGTIRYVLEMKSSSALANEEPFNMEALINENWYRENGYKIICKNQDLRIESWETKGSEEQ
nr:hypothetical protein [uncultured Peptostreptococcus sp.]